MYQDLAHLYRDYEESQKIGNHAISEAYRNALLLEQRERDSTRNTLFLSSRLENSVLDVRDRDLFIRGLANKLDEANQLNVNLHKENLALQDELIKQRLRYESDSQEYNDTIRKLRRLLEEKEDEINMERLRGPGRAEIEERERLTREVARLRRELIQQGETLRKEREWTGLDSDGMPERRGTVMTRGSAGGNGGAETETSSLRVKLC